MERDFIIRPSGKIKKRRKKLSKNSEGDSHEISMEEAKHAFAKKVPRLIVGTGMEGGLSISDIAATYLDKKKCEVEVLPTPEAAKRWNELDGKAVGLFHFTD
ncbi:MAG: MTH938/NDUFAF3 family protein [Candidatus Latescibacteria bacterium]|nr:MTH938/NDUFAF3 family protein [Candidatus Latescibacterota bacterium]